MHIHLGTCKASGWEGSNEHYFGSVCHLSAVALGDKITQKKKQTKNKTPLSCGFSEDPHPGRRFADLSDLEICLRVDEKSDCEEKSYIGKKIK